MKGVKGVLLGISGMPVWIGKQKGIKEGSREITIPVPWIAPGKGQDSPLRLSCII